MSVEKSHTPVSKTPCRVRVWRLVEWPIYISGRFEVNCPAPTLSRNMFRRYFTVTDFFSTFGEHLHVFNPHRRRASAIHFFPRCRSTSRASPSEMLCESTSVCAGSCRAVVHAECSMRCLPGVSVPRSVMCGATQAVVCGTIVCRPPRPCFASAHAPETA